ncbi:MAG TPA: hypothetical protein VKG01_18495 [Thermoanaerobaculia bacterium]|nr:hypothetical protein [Thermoanaerobaculia bacterium]
MSVPFASCSAAFVDNNGTDPMRFQIAVVAVLGLLCLPPAAAGQGSDSRNLFQSDMWIMTGMTLHDPMGGMAMPGWHVMDLGIFRGVYNKQGGPSGDEAFESSNWNMLHASHDLGGGRLTLMLMNSIEPATMEKRGSPEIFQEGETFEGQPLIDYQHPHDFWMNLSATYRRSVGTDGAFWLQLAPVGEPALGPTAFMHRASAGENPTAPLSHHGQDSTHVTFGVITAGFGWRWLILEGSAFHGAEPNENRWDFEHGALDSASGRIRLELPEGWSAQASYASRKDPEVIFPGTKHRATASLHYGAAGDRPVAFSLIWGRDYDGGKGQPSTFGIFRIVPLAVRHPNAPKGYTDYWLLEGAFQASPVDQVYARAEYVDRNLQLLLTKEGALPGQPVATTIVKIKALTFGYFRDFELLPWLRFGAGLDFTGYKYPSELDSTYGNRPLSTHVFLRLRWGKPHDMEHAM